MLRLGGTGSASVRERLVGPGKALEQARPHWQSQCHPAVLVRRQARVSCSSHCLTWWPPDTQGQPFPRQTGHTITKLETHAHLRCTRTTSTNTTSSTSTMDRSVTIRATALLDRGSGFLRVADDVREVRPRGESGTTIGPGPDSGMAGVWPLGDSVEVADDGWGKSGPASSHSGQSSRHTSVSALTRPSVSQPA